MSRPTIRRLANLEKEAATVLATVQYPPILPLAERKGWTLQQHMELYERVRRGEYSVNPEEFDGRKKIHWEGKTPKEMADPYEQSCREAKEEVRREIETWRSADLSEPSSPR